MQVFATREGVEVKLDGPASVAAAERVRALPGVETTPLGIRVPRNVFGLKLVRDLLGDALVDAEFVSMRLPPDLQLLPHQVEAIEFAASHGGSVLLGDEMGAGKTRSAIGIASARRLVDPTRRTLISAPRALRASWVAELAACGFGEPQVLQGTDFTTQDTDKVKNPWWFIHYEVLDAWIGRLHRYRFDTVILDEGHLLRNPSAKRTQAVQVVAGMAAARVVLTGTPVVNRPGDLWPLLSIVTGKGTWGSRLAFRQRYAGAIHNGYGYEDVGPTNNDELQVRMSTCYLRRTLDEIGVNLPPFSRSVVEAVLDASLVAEHRAVCDLSDPRALEEIVAALVSGQVKTDVLATLTKLRSLTARGKVQTTIEHVRSIVDQEESVVVFAHERATVKALAAKLEATWKGKLIDAPRVYQVTGEDAHRVRDEACREFQMFGGVLFATFGALGVGVTLHKARAVVIHDLPWTFADLLQAEARIHRIGQKHPTRAFWVIAAGTVDRVIGRVLQRKAEVHAATGMPDANKALNDTGLVTRAMDDQELVEWLALAGAGD
jgi:SWI/SNF-related matrix-associated actin-dependent regulator 1 of chromatin subfamily A